MKTNIEKYGNAGGSGGKRPLTVMKSGTVKEITIWEP